jgi:hypothetical protein
MRPLCVKADSLAPGWGGGHCLEGEGVTQGECGMAGGVPALARQRMGRGDWHSPGGARVIWITKKRLARRLR